MPPPPDWITLRLFLAALDLGSISRAARRCGIAVSAAAKRLQDLETEQGQRLLDRTARGVHPTAAGQALARHARVLQDLAARLADDMRAFAAGGLGSVRLHATTWPRRWPALPQRIRACGSNCARTPASPS